MFRVELAVVPRPGVKDPQAEAVQETLGKLGYTGVAVMGVGRLLALSIDCKSEGDVAYDTRRWPSSFFSLAPGSTAGL